MTVLDFVRLTRANLALLIAAVLVGAGAALLYARTLPVTYTAEATAYVVAGSSGSVPDAFSGMTLAQQKAQSYVPLVTGRSVGSRMFKELGWGTPAGLSASLAASATEGSNLLKVYATSGDPETARLLADAGMRALVAEAHFLETLNQGPGSSAVPVVQVMPIDDAIAPGASSVPNIRRLLLIGLAAGLVLGYAIALLRKQLDSRVRNVEDVERIAGSSVLGVIPTTREIAKQRTEGFLGLGDATESLRHLRTNLRFVDIDRRPRSLVVTSGSPGEGKSSVSSNLARVLAESGQPTVIVDADLRRPMLAQLLRTDGSLGVTQVVAGDLDLRLALQDTDTTGLKFLPAGRIPPNPSELLGSQRMRALIDELAKDYFVILDAPPLLPVTDAGLLAVVTDGALLVIATGRTRKEELALCAKIFTQVGGKLLGTVMNMAPKRGMGSVLYGYGYGGYSKSHYYEYSSRDRQGGRRWRRKGLKLPGRAAS